MAGFRSKTVVTNEISVQEEEEDSIWAKMQIIIQCPIALDECIDVDKKMVHTVDRCGTTESLYP
jgi:hypothetical protein